MKTTAFLAGFCAVMATFSAAAQTSVSAQTGTNLLVNSDFSAPLVRSAFREPGWDSGIWIFGKENREKFSKEATKLAKAAIADTKEGKVLELKRPAEIETLMGTESPKFTLSSTQIAALGDENGGTYLLSFDMRYETIGKNQAAHYVLVAFTDASDQRRGRGRETGKMFIRALKATKDWQSIQFKIPVPAKTRDIRIAFRGDGAGILQIKNPKLRKNAQ